MWQALEAVETGLGGLAEGNLWALSEAEVLALRERLEAVRARTEAVTLGATREVDCRGAARAVGADSTAGWLRGRLRLHPGAAREEVRLAHELAARFPRVGEALAAGELSRAQAVVVVNALKPVAKATDAVTLAKATAFLLAQARVFDPQPLGRLGQRLGQVLDPDRDTDRDAELDEQQHARELAWSQDADGSLRLRGRLPAEQAQLVREVLDPLSAPQPAQDGTPDPRTATQRRADALVALAAHHRGCGHVPAHAGEQVTVNVIVRADTLAGLRAGQVCPTCAQPTPAPDPAQPADPAQPGRSGLVPDPAVFDDGTPLGPQTTRRLACDSWLAYAIQTSQGTLLDIGRRSRTVPPALRRALMLRDRGCAFPGCGRPPTWCQAHHIRHWAHGGPTEINNLVLVCGHHHRWVHTRGWDIHLARGGLPHFAPPAWIDPDRTPRPPWRPPGEIQLE